MEKENVLYDKDIREPLFDFLEEFYGKTRIIEEKRIGRSRADIVLVKPSCVAGIEIKSDADTYTRLKGQVRDYNQYFDRNYVVVGSSHALHVEEHVPGWWGIISVEWMDGMVDFYLLREAKENPKNNPGPFIAEIEFMERIKYNVGENYRKREYYIDRS